MSTTAEKPTPPTTVSHGRRPLPWFVHGLATTGIILALSLASWWLLVDASWSPLSIYPQPFSALLFWGVISVVWLGFNLEFWGFDRLGQPWRGLALVAAALAISLVMTMAFAHGYGRFDPTFAADRDLGAGYGASGLWVLFGFFFYVTSVVNWGNWPFVKSGLTQPWLGIGQIALLVVPTTALYLVLGVPAVAGWTTSSAPIMSEPTVIGWFYSVIVAVVVTGLMTENWPYAMAGSPGRVALASVVGNLVLGSVIYVVLKALAGILIGSANTVALGPAMTVFAAQLGVCWVVWMIIWQNCFANKPDSLPLAARCVARLGITFVLGVLTFLAYYFVVAEQVLHEPAVIGSISGNALGWWNWVVLWTLVYVLGFQSWGLVPRPEAPADTVVEAPGTTTTAT